MIQIQSCRNFLALIFPLFVLTCNPILSQFSIDTSAVPSGILWKQTHYMLKPPTSGDTVDYDSGWQAIKSLLNSRLSHDGTGITDRRKMAAAEDLAVNTVVLFPTALRYEYIDGDELAYFDTLQGKHYVPEAFTDSVYKSDIAFFVAPSEASLHDRQVRFVVSEMSQWSNMQGIWEADFGDGMGWFFLEVGVPHLVVYDNEMNDRLIRFRFTSDEGTFFTSTKLKGSSVTGCSLLPHNPPWMENENLPWRISTSFQGSEVAGNAYTLWSEDGVFDKPFVFVEGIDFNLQQWQGQLGDFGWCQFMGNDHEHYPMLAQSSEMVDALRERGYDLILLDFVDGAADIRSNAALLKYLISLCNAYKEDQNQLIVAGASMGGQVARVALAEMERDGQEHCTGVYVSWDSPHQGAHIPLAIQTTIDFLSPFSAEAEAFETGALSRPASKQMLINQYFDSMGQILNPPDFQAFQNYLDDLGIPKRTINWAIANGSGFGTPLENLEWTPLLETSCNASSIFSGDEFRMWLYAAPGNPEHTFSTQDMFVIADLIYSETYSSLLSFAYIEYSGVYSISSLAPALDYRPGGYRTSVKELVDVINDNSDYLNVCNFIGTDQYTLKHSFISPHSALDFQGNVNIGILDALVAEPNTTPFDDWYVPAGDNQPHVAMTPQNIQWLLQRIDAVNEWIATEETFPCSPYVLGSMEDKYLFSTSLIGVQEVVLNGNGNVHCGQFQEAQPTMLKMRLVPDCNHIGFVLMDKTVLKIGEMDGSRKCQLMLSPGSKIAMYDKSRLMLGLGSQIIVGPGSKIIMEDLSSLLNFGGDIIVQEGGQIYFNGTGLSLEHDEARLIFQEGLLHIADGKTLILQPENGSSGKVVVRSQHQPAIEFGAGAKLIIQGESYEDEVVWIDSASKFFSHNDFQGAIFIKNGAFRFENGSQWYCQALLDMDRVKLYSVGAYENQQIDVVFQNNRIMMSGCLWYHLSVCGIKSHLRCIASKWVGNEIQDWLMGSLTISESDMLGVGWRCEAVGLPFSYRSVTFSGNGSPIGLKVKGLVNAPLSVEDCDFSDYEIGIEQSGGALKMACSRLSHLFDGMVLINGVQLTMNNGAGSNAFDNNDYHIVFNEVSPPDLLNGGNWFGLANQHAIHGLIAIPFAATTMNWSGNEWFGCSVHVESYVQTDPNQLYFNALEFEPSQPFSNCKSMDSGVKSLKTESIVALEMDEVDENAIYDIYNLNGQRIEDNLNLLEYRRWLSQDAVAAGLYVVMVQTGNEIITEKVLFP